MSILINPQILRAYDIRGVYPSEISSSVFSILGKAFGSLILEQGGKNVCVGYDGRLSSPDLEEALVEGLVSTGLKVFRIGCVPSPMLYFAERHLGTDGAMMVTGSHNPSEYNGVKMILNHQPFFGEMIQDLGKKATSGSFATGNGDIVTLDLHETYVNHLVSDFSAFYSNGKKMRIAWDPAHGAGAEIVASLTKQLPGEHFVINGTIDGTFPAHHPDPTLPENLEQLRQLVLEKNCDAGIGLDGDADRIGMVDNEGNFIWGDQFLMLYAEEIINTSPGATILADVKASQTFFDRVLEMGGNAVMVSTGHSNIKHKIKETGALLAGEMSGHVFFADRYYGYDDALYAAIRLIGILSLRPETLDEWRRKLPQVKNTPEIKIPCTNRDKQKIVINLRENLKRQNASWVDIDGVRVMCDGGWWLLRASNTQDYLIGRVEADSDEALDRLTKQMYASLSEAGMDHMV